VSPCGTHSTALAHITSIISERPTYLLELVLIRDDEAISIRRPLDSGAIMSAFSVQHYSKLLLRGFPLKQKRVSRIETSTCSSCRELLLPFVGIALRNQLLAVPSGELSDQLQLRPLQRLVILIEMSVALPPLLTPLWPWLMPMMVRLL
jgi:hypothetical protein